MTKSLENPFHPSPQADPDLLALAEQGFLPPDEVAKLKELESQKNRSSEFGIRHLMSDVSLEEGLSVGEREAFNEAREKRETRQGLVKWADEFGLGGEEWVDKTFVFNLDGTAVCNGSLRLNHKGITHFPKGIVEVKKAVNLTGNQLEKIENLPPIIGGVLYLGKNLIRRIENLPMSLGSGLDLSLNRIEVLENLPEGINGHLSLMGNPIVDLEGLPQAVERELILYNVPAQTIPAGLELGSVIKLTRKQKELERDARSKGYQVEVG